MFFLFFWECLQKNNKGKVLTKFFFFFLFCACLMIASHFTFNRLPLVCCKRLDFHRLCISQILWSGFWEYFAATKYWDLEWCAMYPLARTGTFKKLNFQYFSSRKNMWNTSPRKISVVYSIVNVQSPLWSPVYYK